MQHRQYRGADHCSLLSVCRYQFSLLLRLPGAPQNCVLSFNNPRKSTPPPWCLGPLSCIDISAVLATCSQSVLCRRPTQHPFLRSMRVIGIVCARFLVLQAAGSLCVEAPGNLVRPAARILRPGARVCRSPGLLPKPHICSALP
jgi:hypothetical protein